MRRAAVLAFGVVSYAIFFATFLYLVGFLGNLVVPTSVDSGVPGSVGTAFLVNTLLLRTNEAFHEDAIADLARAIIQECAAVGRAEGAVLEDDVADAVIKAYRASPRDGVNSLLADRRAGRPLELDARNGVIVRLGRRHGTTRYLSPNRAAISREATTSRQLSKSFRWPV